MNRNNLLITAAFGVLAVIAVIGWTRKTGTSAVQPYQSSVPASYPAAYPPTDRGVLDRGVAEGNTLDRSGVDRGMVYGESSPVREDRYYSDRYVQSIHRPVRVVAREPGDRVAEDVQQRQYADGPVSEVSPAPRSSYAAPRSYETRSYERSKGKSVAIVAGTAAGGAAIGALAGGGKGAALGGLSGGAAGFVYDRLTHNHHR